MMLIRLIHEHGICFHLFVSSLISFSMLCSFLSIGLLLPWLGLFLGILFFLLLFQMGFIFLISISDVSLLVYKNAFDFWILTLYPLLCQIHLLGQAVFWWSL